MSSPSCVSPAYVIDIQAELLVHPNGPRYVRLLLTDEESLRLYRSLDEYWQGWTDE